MCPTCGDEPGGGDQDDEAEVPVVLPVHPHAGVCSVCSVSIEAVCVCPCCRRGSTTLQGTASAAATTAVYTPHTTLGPAPGGESAAPPAAARRRRRDWS